jgi:hypothetical protein
VLFSANFTKRLVFFADFGLGFVASLNQFLDFLLESSHSLAKIAKRIESSGIDSRNRPSTNARPPLEGTYTSRTQTRGAEGGDSSNLNIVLGAFRHMSQKVVYEVKCLLNISKA